MVIFDRLEITPDAKNLIIDAHVSKAKYYEGWTIEGVYINSEDCYLESNAISVNLEKAEYEEEINNLTEIHLVINCNKLKTLTDFSNNLFFVYIKEKQAVNECISCLPCGADDEYTLGVTFDTGLLYNIALGYIKELADNCNPPQGFSDFILNWEGFKIFLESEHYIDAIKIFNKWFKNNKGGVVASSNCGCHGKVFS